MKGIWAKEASASRYKHDKAVRQKTCHKETIKEGDSVFMEFPECKTKVENREGPAKVIEELKDKSFCLVY
jgi:hypothetical protein